MFLKSIRFRFIFWYTLILTVTLASFSAFIYGDFRKNIYDDLDDLLSSRAEGVVNSISAYLQTSGEKSDLLNLARKWVEEPRKDPELMNVSVQILSTSAETIISSKFLPHIAPLPRDDFEDIVSGEDSFDTVKGESLLKKKEKFRVYSRPVLINGKTAYVVQSVAPLDLLSIALNDLGFVLFLFLPLVVVLAAIPGVFLVTLTLRPIRAMIKTLRQITAENLKLKIHIPDTKDEIRQLADTFNDMIDRLDRSFSSQQNFIQDISEELKTPITELKTELESAVGMARSPQEYQVILKGAMGELDKFSKVIENLETLSRFDNNQVPLEIKKINLTHIVERILDDMKSSAEEKDIAIFSFLQDIIKLDGDQKQLQRLLTNILDNAIKYTYRKGKITVTVHKHNKHARVIISDTGLGMPEDEIPYIFDRFYQVNKPRKLNGSFGLGLSTAKSIVEAHKGTISVESLVGKGSTFTVSLPLSYTA